MNSVHASSPQDEVAERDRQRSTSAECKATSPANRAILYGKTQAESERALEVGRSAYSLAEQRRSTR